MMRDGPPGIRVIRRAAQRAGVALHEVTSSLFKALDAVEEREVGLDPGTDLFFQILFTLQA